MANSLNDGLSKPDQFASAGVDVTEIGSYAVQAVNVSGGAIGASALQSSAVIAAKIGSAAVTSAKIASGNVLSAHVSGGQIGATQLASNAVTNAKIGSAAVTGAKVASGAILGAHISGAVIDYTHMAYGQLGTGSPTAFGNIVQAGQDVGTAGSLLTVNFGNAFLAAPYVFLQPTASGAPTLVTGSVSTTKFTAQCAGGSETINWMAIGSGTL